MRTPRQFRTRVLATMVCAALGGTLLSAPVLASEADVLSKIEALQREIDALKAEVQKAQTGAKAAEATAVEAKAAAKAAAAPAAGAPMSESELTNWRKWFAAVPTGDAPATSARTGIEIYGRADMGYESNYDGTTRRKVLNSYSSRIGFKGTRVLTDDLTGVMQIETGYAPDDSVNSGQWGSRNTYIGLSSAKFGMVLVGKYDSPFKNLEGYGAPMWGQGDANEVIVEGKGTQQASGATWLNFHTRYPNVVRYATPVWVNTQGKIAYSTDEVNGAGGTINKPSWAASVEWDDGTWQLGGAYQNTNNFNGNGKDMWGYKLSAGGKLGPATLGVLYSRLDNDIGKTTNNWSLAGTYKLGPTVLKASYGASSETADGANDGCSMWGAEIDYPLDKHTTIYAFYTKIDNDAKAKCRFAAGENTFTPAAGTDPNVTAIALRYNF